MIYFDNAATTFPKPQSVLNAVNTCIKSYCGNPGRSGHVLSLKTSERIYEAREAVCNFLNAKNPENVIFTQNATYALNIAIKSMIPDGSHVIISDLEHNSVLRPINALCERNSVKYSVFDTSEQPEIAIQKKLCENTTCIISTLSSNVTGKRIKLKSLSQASKKFGLKLIVDASQYIGHGAINLEECDCDVLCAPGHKALFGIQGIGFAYYKNNEPVKTIIEGGSGNNSQSIFMPNLLPERLEGGTLPSPAIISLLYGIKFINSVGIERINEKLNELTDLCMDRLNDIGGIKIYGGECGVIGFNISDIPSYVISEELDKRGICTRSGLHCAPLAHRRLGTPDHGCVRVSFSYFNKPKEIDKLSKALLEIKSKY